MGNVANERILFSVCAGFSGFSLASESEDTWRDRRQVARASASVRPLLRASPMAFLISLPWLALTTIAAFIAGRWSFILKPSQKPLDDVATEVKPHLYSPPVGHGLVSVPSVVRDARGEVHNLEAGGFRFNVLVSHAGVLRSGDVHRSRQFDLIFSGTVTVTTREKGRDVTRRYSDGDLVVIPANVPHIFRFLNRTVRAYASRAR